ncbi:hypothetical protein DYB28_009672 [Aphanomyces astaci]|uniref:Uncharacterized protein n=2 Tax=Aphanomyces astaci TaxID=112090 RepID=A0A9X8HG89_APHAT|nr:hypothetical protein DYB28_009672 [Aphanomyces astaci]
MVFVGGLLCCLALIPLVMSPTKPESFGLTDAASNVVTAIPSIHTGSRFRPEVGDDFNFTMPEREGNPELVDAEPTVESNAQLPVAEPIPSTTPEPSVDVSAVDALVQSTKHESDAASTMPTLVIDDTTPGVGASHHGHFTYPPECSEADMIAVAANLPVSEECHTAYKLFALEQGGKALITRKDEVLPSTEYPVECSADDVAALDIASGVVQNAAVSAECAEAYEAVRQTQLHLHLESLEAELAQLRAQLASTDP